ncbi:phage holin family protein [Nocardia shimofusensis]|uniref:phage holin family protein n=1 Tax=Nocardia shimofusensis TaxID=228596 RepID=UPI000832F08E|nr:phage holin family protein [Nocardia shimofusensis]
MVQHTQHRVNPGDRSMSELVEDATAQVSRLVRDEMRLARAEIAEKAGGIAKGTGVAGAGAVLALYGGVALTAAAVFALALVLPEWASALIVGVALLAVGGVLALIGKNKVTRAAPPLPTEAQEGVREDLAAIREGSRR